MGSRATSSHSKAKARRVAAGRKVLATKSPGSADARAAHTTVNISNLGPVEEATIELRPLTILAGTNNTGKSTVANALFGYLAGLTDDNVMDAFLNSGRYRSHPLYTARHHGEFTRSGETLVELDRDSFIREASRYLEQFGVAYSKNMHHVFNLAAQDFTTARFELVQGERQLGRYFDALDARLSMKFGSVAFTFSREGKQGQDRLSVSIQSRHSEANASDNARKNLAVTLDGVLFLSLFPKPHFFPSDRASIGLFYKELDEHKSAFLKHAQGNGAPTPAAMARKLARYVAPVYHNINFVRSLPNIVGQGSFLGTDRQGKFHRLIEKALGVRYQVVNEGIRVNSLPGAKHKFDIPFHLASAATREMAALYFYLKHQAQPYDLVFIDEPEAHMDPHNQVLLARLICNCVNADVHVFLTTHSNILVRELNHLMILGSGIRARQGFHDRFPEYRTQDALDPETVSAYTCHRRTAYPCRKNSRGLDMPTFDGALNDLNQTSMAFDSLLSEHDAP